MGVRIDRLEGRLHLHAGHDHAPMAPQPSAPVFASVPLEAAAGQQLLPDMVPVVSDVDGYVYGWEYDVDEIPGRILLRLTTATGNRGAGAMELRGGAVLPNGSQEVHQRIYRAGGGFTDQLAGTFTYHAEHEHIHFDAFAAYQLRTVTAGDGVGAVVSTGDKVSFCLLDLEPFEPSLPGAPASGRYNSCESVQGISVGWADVYDKSLADQWVDVTDVPDGRYWLEVVADPENRLLESDETNNAARILIDLTKPSRDPLIVSHTPEGQYPVPASSVEFRFDQPMRTTSFRVADDVSSFTGPGGADLRSQVTGYSWPDNRTLRVSFNTQAATGDYAMTVGPGILAADDGAPLDQDRDKTPGEIPGDRYTARFKVDNRVGPDAFGYEAWAATFEAIDLVKGAPGVSTIVDNQDDVSMAIAIGTNTFNFYGTTYTGAAGVYASSNGVVTFGASEYVFSNGDLVDDPPRPAIAVLWDDLRTDENANDAVLAKLEDTTGDGKDDRLIIEWSQVRRHSDDGPADKTEMTFQAILTLNTGAAPGTIVLNYPDIDTGSRYSNAGDATVGIKGAGVQDQPAARRLLISRDRGTHPFLSSGKAIRIERAVPTVAGRHLFYNRSIYDGGATGAAYQDDAAVAPDKSALLPGGGAGTLANVSSYSRGINGVMVDVRGLPDRTLLPSDFEFRAGNTSTSSAWATAPAPTISVRRGAGIGGSDRVTLVWHDNAIRNKWLRVTVMATANTGLAAPDVFYFGNLAGESVAPLTAVNGLDLTRSRSVLNTLATISSPYDHNRDGRVNSLDLAVVRASQRRRLTVFSDGPAASAASAVDLSANISAHRQAAALKFRLACLGLIDP
jgi:hypothetical protein